MTILVCFHFGYMLPVKIPQMELGGLLLVFIYIPIIFIFVAIFTILGAIQFEEQKRIEEISVSPFFDIGYILGFIIFIFLVGFLIVSGFPVH